MALTSLNGGSPPRTSTLIISVISLISMIVFLSTKRIRYGYYLHVDSKDILYSNFFVMKTMEDNIVGILGLISSISVIFGTLNRNATMILPFLMLQPSLTVFFYVSEYQMFQWVNVSNGIQLPVIIISIVVSVILTAYFWLKVYDYWKQLKVKYEVRN